MKYFAPQSNHEKRCAITILLVSQLPHSRILGANVMKNIQNIRIVIKCLKKIIISVQSHTLLAASLTKILGDSIEASEDILFRFSGGEVTVVLLESESESEFET